MCKANKLLLPGGVCSMHLKEIEYWVFFYYFFIQPKYTHTPAQTIRQ